MKLEEPVRAAPRYVLQRVLKEAAHQGFDVMMGHENVFGDSQDKYGLSATAKAFIQGILDHAPAMMPLIGPTPNCYRRLKPHTFAPSNISWGSEDRSAMIRVKGTGDESTHLEMRAASGLSNPYLTAAATIAAGLLGVKQQRELSPPVEGPSEDNPDLPKLPQNLEQALEGLAADTQMQEMLGEEFCQLFIYYSKTLRVKPLPQPCD